MRWVTFFPEIENVHLTKDIGLLPLFMQEKAGYEATLLGRYTSTHYPALEGEAVNLRTEKLTDRGHFLFLQKSMIRYLRKNARHIHVLQLLHLSRSTMLYGILFKWLNPKGFLYVKVDAYNTRLEHPQPLAKGTFKLWVMELVQKRFFKAADLISIENTEGVQIASRTWPSIAGKFMYLPNGVNDLYIEELQDIDRFAKENIILTVTRAGSPEKNCELLLEAMPFLQLTGWQILVVGEMTEAFRNKWEIAKAKNPEIAQSIRFTGLISDRAEMYSIYARSRIFFLPSRVESFGIAFAEALWFGTYIVGHDGMFAFKDLSSSGKFGTRYTDNDPRSLASALEKAVQKVTSQDVLPAEIRVHARTHFAWSGIAERLGHAIHLRRSSVPK